MLTYELKKAPGIPLYEALYRCIRKDILTGALPPGTKLPSKRALSAHLEVSKITVENAYNQLLSEGFLRSVERVGYFVEAVEGGVLPPPPPTALPEAPRGEGGMFPFSVWSRLQREVMLDLGQTLLLPLPNRGVYELRQAIAAHLSAFRGMAVDPAHILIGAGTDFLYNLLIQLLGREKIYAVEEPGYDKIRKIYAAGGVRCELAPMDEQGVIPAGLENAQVLHISPSHHFPTGLVTPGKRRRELLSWAAAAPDRYIIEADYDSEFRFHAHPVPAMHTMDSAGRVIYMNTFSKSLAPSIRISYMVLPPKLMEVFQTKLGFYSCTVPSFEQYTLARFLSRGYFEKHINRMRRRYKLRRNRLISLLQSSPYAKRLTILEQDAGLHFLLKVDTRLSDEELAARCREAGVPLRTLSSYYAGSVPESDRHCLLVSYADLSEQAMDALMKSGE